MLIPSKQLNSLWKRGESLGCSTELVCAAWNGGEDLRTNRFGKEIEWLEGRTEQNEDREDENGDEFDDCVEARGEEARLFALNA